MAALARCPEPCLAELLLVGPLSASQSVDLVAGLAAAIDALGEAGLVARDVTPYHVHLDPRLGGVLRDGAMPVNLVESPVLDADEHLAYRSPEHIEGKPIDLRSNVYSLGALLYAALVGSPPFGGTWSHVYVSHLSETRPRPSERRGDLPAAIDAVVTRAIAVDPADRYDRPADLARAAATALGVALNIKLVATNEAGPAEQPAPEPAESQAAKPVSASEGASAATRTGTPKRGPGAKQAPARARTRKSSTPDNGAPASRPHSAAEPKRRGKAAPVANGKPTAANGKPAPARNGKPAATNGKPAATNGKPAATNGKPAATNGKPAATNGKSNAAPARLASLRRDRSGAKRRNAEAKRTTRNGSPGREDVNGLAAEARGSAPAANGNAPAANRRAPGEPRSVDDGRTANVRTENGRRAGKGDSETIPTATRVAPVAIGSYAISRGNDSGGHAVAAPASATIVVRLKPALRPRRSGLSACAAAPAPVAVQRLKRSSRKGALVVLGAAGIAAAAIATVGMTGSDENRGSRIASNGLSIRMPAAWERVAPPTARLDWLSGTLAAANSDLIGATLVTGQIRDHAVGEKTLRSLLPDGATPKTVRLDGFAASRYSNLSLGAGLTGTAFVMHTTGSSVAVICRVPIHNAKALLGQCTDAASTVRLSGERPVSPEVAARRTPTVRAVLRQLSQARTTGRRQVAEALIADDQAAAARSLETRYVEAAARIELSGMYGPKADALGSGLRAAGAAYGDLATSIADSDQRAYDAARAAVLEAETQVWGASAAN